MPPTVPTREPTQLIAGNTWTWNRIFADFPTTDSPPWTITYYLTGPTALAGIVASVDPTGKGWLVATTAAFSASALPGTYQWVAKALRSNALMPGGTEQYDADAGVFTVVPNYQTAAATPTTSFNQTMLAQIEAVLLNRTSADVQEYTIGGRRMVKIPVLELEGMKAIYEYRVAKERRPGQQAITNKVRFCNVA